MFPRERQLRLTHKRWLILPLLVFLAACGSDANPPPGPPPAGPAAPRPAEPEAVNLEGWTVLGENPKWKPIKGMFEAYAKREVTGLHNPMTSNLVAFVERPVPTAAPPEEVAEKSPEVVERTRFNSAPLTSLSLIMLVTGVAQPKAVLLDGHGEQLVVSRGDHLGSEGGVVKAITQYELQISIPGAPDAVMSMKPPLNPVEELDAEVQQPGKKPEL